MDKSIQEIILDFSSSLRAGVNVLLAFGLVTLISVIALQSL